MRVRRLERAFKAAIKSFKGIVCPGEVVNGPEIKLSHIHMESRLPSGRVSRFFACKCVLDGVRNFAVFEYLLVACF